MTIKLSEEAKRVATELLPGYMVQPMIDYFEQGLHPGGFLSAVLANDLVGAVNHADDTNKDYISKYVLWLYWHAPGRASGAWGSYEAIDTWVAEAQTERSLLVD